MNVYELVHVGGTMGLWAGLLACGRDYGLSVIAQYENGKQEQEGAEGESDDGSTFRSPYHDFVFL